MQEKFTRQAKAALKLAESAARSWKHSYIGTEHILVGLLDEQEGTAGKILEEFGVDREKLESLITKLIAPSGVLVAEKSAGYSPRAQKVREQAVKEAEKQNEDLASASGNAQGDRLCRNQTSVYHGCKYPEIIQCSSRSSRD